MQNNSELSVITKAKELSSYILTITDKSPKKYRFTLVSRLQNYGLDILEELYLANSILLTKTISEGERRNRRYHQQKAMTRLRLLGYIVMLAREVQCILPKQQAIIADKIIEIQRLLYAWEKSDESRIDRFVIKG